ncbi:MAG: restriction endonuclease subunit S [Paludibacteraceae bacterium]|nr:restriction endonuclease subunit S [Paludibacteraceae bacterium]
MKEPKVRFPGFTGEWVEKKLGEVLDYEQPTNYLVEDTNYKNNGIPVLTAGKTFILGYTDETHGIYNNLPVIIFDDFVTDSKFVDFPFKTKSSAMKMLKLSDNNNNLRLIYELMQLLKYPVKEHKRYWISEYSKLTIPLPPTPSEQQKIAECLTAIDDLIVAQGKKVDALKEHKKGLVQQLFPQPGETTPRLRFPGFTDEWIEKKLGDCFEFRQGVQCPVDLQSLQKKEGDIRFIRIIDLTQPSEPPRYIADPGFIHHISKNDLFMVRYGSPGLVGYGYEGVIANNLFRLLPKFDICTKFCKYVLTNLQKEIVELSGASTMPAVNFTTLGLLRIVFPKTLAEQQKIAECLSTLDDQIKAESAELDALTEHKKGLMQQLFPQPSK